MLLDLLPTVGTEHILPVLKELIKEERLTPLEASLRLNLLSLHITPTIDSIRMLLVSTHVYILLIQGVGWGLT